MTRDLFRVRGEREAPARKWRCEWMIRPRWSDVRQCSREAREIHDGHGYCHSHGKMARTVA